MSQLIDGRELAEQIKLELQKEISDQNLEPHLAAVLIGNDPASQLYVTLKERACHEIGISFTKYLLDEQSKPEKVKEVIEFLNNDPEINGIIVQLPLPSQLNQDEVIGLIDSAKDADGFGPKNLADFMEYKAKIIPALPNAIYELIKSTGVDLAGKQALVISNSEIFAKPIMNMMKYKKGSAEYASPDEPELFKKTQNADIIIIAVGRKWFLDHAMVKEGAIVIDVGINKTETGTTGDVNPDVDEVAAFRSPVPGGVGPMTIAMLLKNTVELFKLQKDS